jgi:hypothetical protein
LKKFFIVTVALLPDRHDFKWGVLIQGALGKHKRCLAAAVVAKEAL